MFQVPLILFGVGFTLATCYALGRLLLGLLPVRLYRQEERLFAWLAGSALLSLLVFLLAALGLVHPATFLAVGSVAVGLALWRRPRSQAESLPALPALWHRVYWLTMVVFGTVYFIHALAPEVSPDGSTYHLGLVARYLREAGFRKISTNMYANLSQGIEMLYLFAFAFGRHSAAALVHFAFLITLPVAMALWGRRSGSPAAGVIGAGLVFLSPVVGLDGSSAYIDVAVATILFTCYYLLRIWNDSHEQGLLMLTGLVAGFAFAAKYTAFLAFPYALVWVAWKLLRERKKLLVSLALLLATAVPMVAPWMVKNWIWAANPLSPFFNRWFPNPYIHIRQEETYRRMLRHYAGLERSIDIPWAATVKGGALQGLLGPLFLLAPVSLLALRRREGRGLLLAAVVFGSPYALNLGTRFLIPALPFLSLAMGLALGRTPRLAVGLLAAHSVLSWPYNIGWYADEHAWRIRRIPLAQALRIEPEESYLGRRLPSYTVARMIERSTPPGAKIFAVTGPAEAYTTRDVLVGYQAALNNNAQAMIWAPLVPHLSPTGRLLFRFPPGRFRAVRVVQTARLPEGDWSIHEFRIFNGERELERSPQWRLRAHPNPWEVQFAFDNSPATRWSAWEGLWPGMYVEADFRGSESIDSVLLESSGQPYDTQVALEARTESGDWKPLGSSPERSEQPAPGWLRRAATAELKNLGIDYLLIHDGDFFAAEFRQAPENWGLQVAGETSGARLYRLDVRQ